MCIWKVIAAYFAANIPICAAENIHFSYFTPKIYFLLQKHDFKETLNFHHQQKTNLQKTIVKHFYSFSQSLDTNMWPQGKCDTDMFKFVCLLIFFQRNCVKYIWDLFIFHLNFGSLIFVHHLTGRSTLGQALKIQSAPE